MIIRFLIFLLFLLPISINAQLPNMEESEEIAAPNKGWLKIVQLKNGNTLLAHIQFGRQINIKIFDKTRKLKIDKLLSPDIASKRDLNPEYSVVKDFTVINDNAVLFVGNVIDKKFTIARIVIDGKNGNIISEVNIGDFEPYTFGIAYEFAQGIKKPNAFFVKKDPQSDNYGIALFHGCADDVNKKLEFLHYSSNHLQISRQFIKSKNKGDYGVRYLDMIVLGDSKLVGLATFYDKNFKDEDAISMLSVEPGNPPVYLKELVFDKKLRVHDFILKYDKKNDVYVMLLMFTLKTDNVGAYVTRILTLSAKNLEILNSKSIDESANINKKFVAYFSENKYQMNGEGLIDLTKPEFQFNGLPQDFIINDNYTYTIISEEMAHYNGSNSVEYTNFYNVAIVSYDRDFNEVENYFIPKNHTAFRCGVLYRKSISTQAHINSEDNAYRSFGFYQYKANKYVLLNEKIGRSVANMRHLPGCEASIITLKDNIETKQSVFKPTKAGNEGPVMAHAISDFNSENGILASIKYDLNKKKIIKVIWIKL